VSSVTMKTVMQVATRIRIRQAYRVKASAVAEPMMFRQL